MEAQDTFIQDQDQSETFFTFEDPKSEIIDVVSESPRKRRLESDVPDSRKRMSHQTEKENLRVTVSNNNNNNNKFRGVKPIEKSTNVDDVITVLENICCLTYPYDSKTDMLKNMQRSSMRIRCDTEIHFNEKRGREKVYFILETMTKNE